MANVDEIEPNTETSNREAKARRTKLTLIVIIVLLIMAVIALGYVAFSFLAFDGDGQVVVVQPVEDIESSQLKNTEVPESARIQTTTIPDLVSCFGLTINEASNRLGIDYQLTKTEEVKDDEDTAVKQLATFTYAPLATTNGKSAGTDQLLGTKIKAQILNIYASLDEEERIIEIYYVGSMDLLGYPTSDFATLVGTLETFTGILREAGVEVDDFSYSAPAISDYTTYVDPGAEKKVIQKESHVVTGASTSEVAPKSWSITITYDYGTGAALDNVPQSDISRTIHLQLK